MLDLNCLGMNLIIPYTLLIEMLFNTFLCPNNIELIRLNTIRKTQNQ